MQANQAFQAELLEKLLESQKKIDSYNGHISVRLDVYACMCNDDYISPNSYSCCGAGW